MARETCPARAITVESEARDSAGREMNVCRRSWQRQATLAAFHALSQATFQRCSIGSVGDDFVRTLLSALSH